MAASCLRFLPDVAAALLNSGVAAMLAADALVAGSTAGLFLSLHFYIPFLSSTAHSQPIMIM